MDDVTSPMSTVTVPLPAQLRATHRPSPRESIGPPRAVLGRLTHVPSVVPVAAGGLIDWGTGVDDVEESTEELVADGDLGPGSGGPVQALNTGARSTNTPTAKASLRLFIRSPKRRSCSFSKTNRAERRCRHLSRADEISLVNGTSTPRATIRMLRIMPTREKVNAAGGRTRCAKEEPSAGHVSFRWQYRTWRVERRRCCV